MSIKNFIPTVWTSAIIQERDRAQIARQICNTSWEGDVKDAGDKVIFAGLADPTINDYEGTVTYEDLDDGLVTMYLDQKKYFAVKIDDVDAVQAKGNLLAAQVKRGGQKLGITADQYVLGLYGQATGGTVTDATCDTTTIIGDITLAAQYLDEQEVPAEGRWMVIAPWVKRKLELAERVKFSLRDGIMWAEYLGFNLYVSNSVTNPTGATTHVTYCLAGGVDSIAYADQLVKTKAESLEGSFSEGVKSLHVYGAKVIRPNELVQLALTYAAETAV